MRPLAILVIFSAGGAAAQIGASPKDAVPELYNKMRQESERPVILPTANQLQEHRQEVAKQERQVTTKLNTMLQLLNGQAAEVERIKAALSEKDMSRVALVEGRLNQIAEEKARAESQQKAEHESQMAWVRLIGGAVIASMLAILTQMILTARRTRRLQHHPPPSSAETLLAEIKKLRQLEAEIASLQGTKEGTADADH